MCASVKKAMKPPFQRNFIPALDAARQDRPRFYQKQPSFRPAAPSMYREDVVVRGPMQSVPQPNHGQNSLPLREVNSRKERNNVRGISTRYDRTSVRCPLHGPLSPMVTADGERYNKGNYSTSGKAHIATTF